MKKSIFLFFAAILCAMSVSAKVIYFKPNGNWAQANANFYAHVWGGSGATSPVKFTPVATDPGVYEAEVGTHNQVIFLRMDPAKTVTSSNMWTSSNDGGPLWNRMGNLSIPTDGKNCCAIKDGQWSQDKNTTNGASSYVTWSTYTPPTETVKYTWTVAGTPASVFEVEWNPEHAANDMVEQADGTYKWEKTNIEFADESSTVKFKVCQEHAWTVAHPSGDYELNISGAGIYTVTITFNTNGNTVNAVATKTGEYVGEAPTHTYSVTGSNADLFGTAWDPAVEENLMETADNVTYTWKKEGVTLMGNFEMKVVQDKAFSVAYPAQNKVVEITEPAIYTVSITFNATSQDIDVNLTKTGEAVIPPVKLYFVNTGNWTELKAHVWADGGNPYKAWEESESMTDTGDDVYGFDVYSYEFPSNYNRIIFKGANDQKTSDDVAAYDAAKPYYCNGVWYASLSEIPAPESLTYTVTVPEGTEECWIAGQMNNWTLTKMNPGAAANQFTLDIVGAAIDHEYKYACKNDWAYAEVREADENGNSNRKAWTALDEVTEWGKPADPAEVKCYLMGIGGDWTTGIEMEEDGDQFKLLCQPIAEGEQFKFKHGDTWSDGVENHDFPGINWVDDDNDGNSNITLPAGNYNFYYKKANNQVWIEAATDCAIEITEVYDITITNLETEVPQPGFLALLGSESELLGLSVQLFLNDYTGENKEYQLNEVSYLTSDNVGELTFVSGSMTQEDYGTDAKIYTGTLIVELQGQYFQFNMTMYKKQLPTKTLTITGADLVVNSWNNITITAVHNSAPVLVQFSDFEYVASKEYTYLMLEVGEWVDEDGDGVCDNVDYISEMIEEATVTISGSTFTLKSKFEGTDANYDLTITGTLPLIIGEGDNSSVLAQNGQTADAYISRTFESGNLYTVSFPFAMNETTTKNVFGSRVEVYEYTSLTEETDGLVLNFTKLSTPQIAAGTPYLVKPNRDANGFGLSDVTISNANNPVTYTCASTTIAMEPVLTVAANATTNGKTQYWLAEDNNLYNKSVNLKGLRAIFNVQTNKSNVRARAAFNENVETGVEDIIATDAPVKVIVNGQLIIIRDGEMYNVQGQLVK